MAILEVKEPAASQSIRVRVLLAFFAIYVLWGSTYLAIRIAVETVPPFFAAGVRFFIAGTGLYVWAKLRAAPSPSRVEWRNLLLLGVLMFLIPYSGLFWAERKIPSGIASVLVATIPVWTTLLEIFAFRKEQLRWSILGVIGLGFAGVWVLTADSNGGTLDTFACLVTLGGAASWAFGTVSTKVLTLPQSKVISAAGQMIFGGALLLVLSGAAGEMNPFPRISREAAAAIAYLIVAGSVIAFTAFVWLLDRMPATKVSSYAYVNPVVALVIGHWLGSETFGGRTLLGAALVLASVLLLLRNKNQANSSKG